MAPEPNKSFLRPDIGLIEVYVIEVQGSEQPNLEDQPTRTNQPEPTRTNQPSKGYKNGWIKQWLKS
jgi:hypothetical protein